MEPNNLKESEAETEANLTPSFNLPNLPEPSPEEIEPKFVPSNHEFARCQSHKTAFFVANFGIKYSILGCFSLESFLG
jgi:hypothetical protein